MSDGLQNVSNKQRKVYADLPKPLLQYMAELHGLSIREFSSIFDVSKGHAEDLMKHRVFPSLELGLRISRYFECSVEDLFGWRVDDDGKRRPLLVDLPEGVFRLGTDTREEKNGVLLVDVLVEAAKRGEVVQVGQKVRK